MMVSQMGFSKELGQVAWSSQGGNQFLGAQMAQPADCSGATQDIIDAEVKVRRAALRCAVMRFALRSWGAAAPALLVRCSPRFVVVSPQQT